jgi:hypothetical protein
VSEAAALLVYVALNEELDTTMGILESNFASMGQRADCYHGPMRDADPPLFLDAIEIPAWLESDRVTAYAERVHRDRAIARGLVSNDSLTRVRAWWRQVRGEQPGEIGVLAERLQAVRRWILVVMMLVGAAVGSGTALAALHYDGTWPVNIVSALGVLVVLPLALILLSILLMCPRLPGLRVVQDLAGTLNPATIVSSLLRRARKLDDPRARALFWHAARGPSAARFARWQMLVWSQAAGLVFSATVLLVAFALVAFTDLAFGWSTTLRIGPEEALRITQRLSLPWRELWPDAVPTRELIEQSRFFRLAAAPPRTIGAAELTGWWPFLLAAIVTYGLLPRMILLLFAAYRLRRAAGQLLLDGPQVRALLDRMRAPEIQLGAADREPAAHVAAARATVPPRDLHQALAILWSNPMSKALIHEWVAQHLGRQISEVIAAGVTLSADREALNQAAAGRPTSILILVRAWEAPLLDLRDFIVELRARVGASCSLIVVPVAPDGALASTSHVATWSRWTAQITDPALYVESGV